MARRTRLPRPYPVNSLEEVLPVAQTIQEVNGGQPVATDMLAGALGTTGKSSAFVQKLNSSARYGLTIGSHTAAQIEITARGESLTAPRSELERANALRAAALEPQAFRGFYEVYSGKRFPESPYASNTLVRELGIRQELTEECLRIIRLNGIFSGIVTETSGSLVVDDSVIRGANGQESAVKSAPDSRPPAAGFAPEESPGSVLVVSSTGGAETELAVTDLLQGLKISATVQELVQPPAESSHQEISDAMRSASACILIWPGEQTSSGESQVGLSVGTLAWIVLGAAWQQLGNRVIVACGPNDDSELHQAAAALGVTVIDSSASDNLYASILSALVGSRVISVSLT